MDYLNSYNYNKQHKWNDRSDAKATTLMDHLREYDFSPASVTLIPSVPGYHKLDSNPKYGHLKVRKEVGRLGRGKDTRTATTDPNGACITMQFSSIGSLTKKYLHRLAYSMDVHRARDAGSGDLSEDDESKPLNLQLVYPTSDEICNSLEGYRGGNSVPGNKKNVTKDFLKPLFRKWSASVSFLSSLSLTRKDESSSNPLWKGNNGRLLANPFHAIAAFPVILTVAFPCPILVPHIKTFFQLSNDAKDDSDPMEWFMIGSHNLSKAAWGDVQDSKTFGEKRFFIRHWELGVFLSAKHLHAKRLVPWTPERTDALSQGDATIPLPYRVKPMPYSESDQPWAVDERYVRLDIFGRRCASDA